MSTLQEKNGSANGSAFGSLPRIKRLAIFLVVLHPEQAATILKQFDDVTVEAISREITALGVIPQEMQKQALEEFSSLVKKATKSVLGGSQHTQKLLTLAKGEFKASSIMGRVGPVGTTTDVVNEIADMDARQIYNLIKTEQPQTIAFILSYLSQEKSAAIVSMMNPDIRDEVIERIGTIDATSLSMVGKVIQRLSKHYDVKIRPALHTSGGIRILADLLNKLDKEVAKNVLAKIEERNPPLGMAVKRKMFNFSDLIRFELKDLQRIMREVDTSNLVIAMKPASEALREKIFGSISKRAAESLKEELQFLGPVRLKDVEVAQDAIMQVVRRLEEEGEISLEGERSNVVV